MNPEVDPSLIIRSYLWAVLKINEPAVWNESNYGGLVPIVPLGEEPELSQFAGPHIIYVHNQSPNDGARSHGGMTIVIADNNFRHLVKTMNIIKHALDRSDESARDVNHFSSNHTVGSTKPFLGLRFGTIRTVYTEGPEPPETEGGRNSAAIDIDYEFYTDYSVNTLPPSWAMGS